MSRLIPSCAPRALACVLAALCALASVAAPREAAADDLAKIITSKKLSNGLEVIVIEDHSVPLVTIEVAVKNGAFTEPPEFNGLSHLYEHMFFKGNAALPKQEDYLKRLRELGIVFNGTTSDERVNYYFTMPSANLKPGMVFMKDALLTPKFDEKEFKNEISVVIGEVDRNESNPYYWLHQAVSKLVWHTHPTRKDALGDRKTITTATTEKMRTMKSRYYVPNNSALLIAGDVKPAEVFALAEANFGKAKWKPSAKDPHVMYPVPEHPPIAKTQVTVVNKPVRVPAVQLVWHGPSVVKDAKATYAADVLSYILGQPTSAYHKALVQSGLTLGAGLGYHTQRYTGAITASAAARPQQLKAAIRAILLELPKMTRPDYFTDAQLASAKKILSVESVYDREKTSSLIHTVSFWWASAGLDYYLNYTKNLNAVTRDDIARYVSTYILDKPFVMGVLVDEATMKQLNLTAPELEKLVAEVQAEIKQGAAAKKTDQ